MTKLFIYLVDNVTKLLLISVLVSFGLTMWAAISLHINAVLVLIPITSLLAVALALVAE